MQKSFGSLELSKRIRPDSQLKKIDLLIDWNKLRPLFKGLYKRDSSCGGGQEPFDSVMMLKAILLGQWHSLSDARLEEALQVRIDFLQFCDLDLSDPVPDETTLCRFRNRLIRKGLLAKLLMQVNEQLRIHGLMVKPTTGAILDATVIESAARPKRTITIELDQEGQEAVNEEGSCPGVICEEKISADPDARWLKKGKRAYFGYRAHFMVDAQEGYIHGVHTVPANQSEVTHLKEAVNSASIGTSRLYADKGYSSRANRQWLRQKKIKSGIMHKAVKNKPLTERQKQANRLISKRRYIIERCFGIGKRLFGLGRASYFGTIKVNAQMILKSLCMNLVKAANKIIEIHAFKEQIRLLSG